MLKELSVGIGAAKVWEVVVGGGAEEQRQSNLTDLLGFEKRILEFGL